MKILVLGSAGQIGWELMRALQPLGRVKGTSRDSLDISNEDDIVRYLRYLQPDVVVNSAALTAVDRLEAQPERADAVNGLAVGVIAQECKRSGALLVQYSSDYVLDGESSTPYREDAPTHPLSVYGKSKLLGEQLAAASGCRHLILRLGGVYSLRRSNFLLSIVGRASAGAHLRVVADQIATPTPAWLLAETTAHMLQRLQFDSNLQSFNGIVNLGCQGATSWHGFATAIIDAIKARQPSQERFRINRCPEIEAITSEELNAAARRPKFAQLDLSRLRNEWHISPPSWETALALTLRDA